MIAKIRNYVKDHKDTITLIIVFVLLFILAFALGYITAIILNKEPLMIEDSNTL